MERFEDKVNTVLTQLAEELELDGSALRLKDGYACLGVNKTQVLHLLLPQGANAVDMFMELGTVPEAVRQSVCEDMLRGNVLFCATKGATLGFDPERGMAVLNQRMPVSGMDLASLKDTLERFLSTAEFWQARLSGEPSSAEPLSDGLLRI
ncbi:MAG TPA: type III secretion system chaperone [Candidatus Avidesulfovibrio excrementigallinarum]|nr:type III secretion system chaperone [Candidatus Avidesulfovibrio excrementigallinarum]